MAIARNSQLYKTELEKEKQALKNALGKAQLSEEKEQENSESPHPA